jgi:hypothetical protein
MQFTAKDRSLKTPVVSVRKGRARLEARNVWEAGGKEIVRENVRMTVLPAKGESREMDVELTWEATSAPVTLQGSPDRGKSYGGFSARFAPREGTILRADGQTLAKDEDLNPRKWAELEGVYNGKPHQWCLRQYGFVGASFPGRTGTVDRYTLEPGKPLTLKFRVRVTGLP